MGGRLRVRRPDLRGLLRLLRHRARHRALARVRADAATSITRTSRVSPPDFWRRWHISLSTWLRDYLYIPLGGNRHGFAAHVLNLMVDVRARRASGTARAGTSSSGAFYHGLLLVASARRAPAGRSAGRARLASCARAASGPAMFVLVQRRLADVSRGRHRDAAARPHAVAGSSRPWNAARAYALCLRVLPSRLALFVPQACGWTAARAAPGRRLPRSARVVLAAACRVALPQPGRASTLIYFQF